VRGGKGGAGIQLFPLFNEGHGLHTTFGGAFEKSDRKIWDEFS